MASRGNEARRSQVGSSSPPKIYTPRAQATRDRVLEAARECVLELGTMNVSSNEIARRAGVSWGVIQYHFGTRDGILVALVETGFALLRQRLQDLEPMDGDLESRLKAVVDAVWDYHTQPDYLLYTDILRSLQTGATSHEGLDDLLRRSDDELATLWATLLEPALPPDGPPVRTVQRLIFATTRGLAISRSLQGPKRSFREERKLLVQSLAAGLSRSCAR